MPSPSKYERQSSDGTTLYTCPICIRIEVNSYDAWLWHLASREHQLSLSKCTSPFTDHKSPYAKNVIPRCVDVHGILGLDSHKVLDYMKIWGEIEDFSYYFKNYGENGKAVRCVCLYRDLEAAISCIDRKTEEYEGKNLRFSAWKEWFSKGVAGGRERGKRYSWPNDTVGSYDSRKRNSERGRDDDGDDDERDYGRGSYKSMRLY